MPRKPRIEVEDGVYHVYNRVASGERLLAEPAVAADFIERLRLVKERDGWTLFAWCVMANHFHLAVRRSTVDLAASLHSLQGTFSRTFNRPRSRSGGLWQSRYQARLIDEQRYLSQVVLYIHLNPVRAGAVDDAGLYPYSGHWEITHRMPRPLVDVDDTLLCFDERRAVARRAYLAGIQAGEEAEKTAGELSTARAESRWWETIPWKEEGLKRSPVHAVRHGADELERRPAVRELLTLICEELSVAQAVLCGHGRTRQLATSRRLVAAVLMERWGVPRHELAALLDRNPEVVSHWASEARARRADDGEFAARIEGLDAAVRARSRFGEER